MSDERIYNPLDQDHLAESIVREFFKGQLHPLFNSIWNVLVEGFGSKVERGGRATTARSVWDILHPGRKENLGIQVVAGMEFKIVADLRNAANLDELRAAIKAHRDAKRQFRKERKTSRG